MARGELIFDALGLLDVVPVADSIQPNDIQDAYAVTVYDYMPIAEAHGRFPLFQHHIADGWALATIRHGCKRKED